jgi:HK97 family phage portal protein
MQKLVFIDGKKSIELAQYPSSAWTWLTGQPETNEQTYKNTVPWLYRAFTILQNTIITIPFVLANKKTKQTIDDSNNWKNILGYFPQFTKLLQLINGSLNGCGKAYLFVERSSIGIKSVRYLNPNSITPILDETGLKGFTRTTNNGSQKHLNVEDIVYFWLPDWEVELGEAKTYPMKAALAAAGVLHNIDEFAASFFMRGAIKATLLTVQGTPRKEEADKLKQWWNNVMTGIRRAWSSEVINADIIKPVTIGEGIDSLANVSLIETKREDIATAFGIPQTMLFSNAANYATANQDTENLLTQTVIPSLQFIFSVLNDQLLAGTPYMLQTNESLMDMFQENEVRRADSYSKYVASGMKPSIAAQMLGLDLPEGVAYEDLDEEDEPEEKLLAEMPPSQENPLLTAQVAEELRNWEKFAIRGLTKTVKREFSCQFISEEMAKHIKEALKLCTTEDDIKRVFNIVPTPQFLDLIKNTQEALDLLRDVSVLL